MSSGGKTTMSPEKYHSVAVDERMVGGHFVELFSANQDHGVKKRGYSCEVHPIPCYGNFVRRGKWIIIPINWLANWKDLKKCLL